MQAAGRDRAGAAEMSDIAIRRVQSYIATHLSGDLSIHMLCRVAMFSPSHLSRVVRQKTGMSLSNYIAGQRLEYACRQLVATRDRVYDIAAAAGYPSAAVFGRFFKHEKGMTPFEYRVRYGGSDVPRGE